MANIAGLLFVCLAGMCLIMFGLWWVQLRTRDPGIVDVAWGLGVAGVAVFLIVQTPGGEPVRRILLGTLITLWALRLSGYVFLRLRSLPPDGRYETLQKNWGSSAGSRMLRFYLGQAFASVLFALPVWLAALNPSPWGVGDFLACVVWFAAIVGETVADAQLAQFRRNPANRGLVCQRGLWRYSRHPNYFFEWLHWCSYPLFAGTTWQGGLAWLGPIAMYYIITRVTGIPPTEAQAVRSRGEAYREYQRTTNAFFPGPRRAGRSAT